MTSGWRRAAGLVRSGLFVLVASALTACPAADDAVKCDLVLKCPVGSLADFSKNAEAMCGASVGISVATESGSGDGMCFGKGDCHLLCKPVEKCCGGSKWTDRSYECAVPCGGQAPPGSGGEPGTGETGGSAGTAEGGSGGDDTSASSGGDTGAGGRNTTSGAGGGSAGKASGGSTGVVGHTQSAALDLGSLGSDPFKIDDGYVGGSETKDFYKFTLDENAIVDYRVDVKGANATVDLYVDAPVLDESKPYARVSATEAQAAVQHIILEKGTYYLRVTPVSGGPLYSLTISADLYEPYQPTPEPGQEASPTKAYDAGTASATLQKYGGYVGGTDAKDYYQLELSTNTTLVLSAMTAETSRVLIRLFPADQTINEADPTAWKIDTGANPVDMRNLAAGKYYVLVTPYVTPNALYTLQFYTK